MVAKGRGEGGMGGKGGVGRGGPNTTAYEGEREGKKWGRLGGG